jgi:hypothetical protein
VHFPSIPLRELGLLMSQEFLCLRPPQVLQPLHHYLLPVQDLGLRSRHHLLVQSGLVHRQPQPDLPVPPDLREPQMGLLLDLPLQLVLLIFLLASSCLLLPLQIGRLALMLGPASRPFLVLLRPGDSAVFPGYYLLPFPHASQAIVLGLIHIVRSSFFLLSCDLLRNSYSLTYQTPLFSANNPLFKWVFHTFTSNNSSH